ncbi:MAG: hypothetical protein KI790_02415 [Cyclobacteriaceae bacterium]|nr:hypothetical protein [Cyclobacteriaceae bacterium HetDA_MAG_MS6]
MKLVLVIIAAFAMLTVKQEPRRSADDLIGKWLADYEMDGEEFSIVYEFKSVNGQLVCYALSIRNSSNETEPMNILVMNDIQFLNGEGTANYMIEYAKENYEVEAELEMPNPDKLNVSYSYYGFGDDEVWERVQ